ncbi:MAG: hypothetical protein AB1664_00685 [Thermodesulfobacteriota bacterium]
MITITLRDKDFTAIGHNRVVSQSEAGDLFWNSQYGYYMKITSVDKENGAFTVQRDYEPTLYERVLHKFVEHPSNRPEIVWFEETSEGKNALDAIARSNNTCASHTADTTADQRKDEANMAT